MPTMKPFLLLAAAITAGAPPYQIDLSRYFANRTAEQSQRTDVLARADAFVNASASALATPQDLAAWLRAYEALLVELRKHDAYVYQTAAALIDRSTTALEALDQR